MELSRRKVALFLLLNKLTEFSLRCGVVEFELVSIVGNPCWMNRHVVQESSLVQISPALRCNDGLPMVLDVCLELLKSGSLESPLTAVARVPQMEFVAGIRISRNPFLFQILIILEVKAPRM